MEIKSLELAHLQLNRCLPSPLGALIVRYAKSRMPKLIQDLEAKRKMVEKKISFEKDYDNLSQTDVNGWSRIIPTNYHNVVDFRILRTNSQGERKMDLWVNIHLYTDGKVVHEVRRFDTEGYDPSGQYPSWGTEQKTEMP
jgi:hypothetical protein